MSTETAISVTDKMDQLARRARMKAKFGTKKAMLASNRSLMVMLSPLLGPL